ncbi:hypothetical protein Tco_0001951 [Tanacetum coccineum]
MSNTNTNLQTQTSNALHNVIMELGGKDRQPMLAPGNYVQWKSRIKRYIDTKPNNELIHYCLQNPPYKFKWTEKTIPVVEGSSKTTTKGYMENYKNVSQDIRNQLDAKAKAVQIILTGIDNDIYSIVDACPNACEMWKAIERLKQGESINVQDLETNLYWEFWKFTSRDGESFESYYSRFYKMMNELVRNQCDVTNHQVNVQFLLQLQPEWQRKYTNLPTTTSELHQTPEEKIRIILQGLTEALGMIIRGQHVARECQKPKRAKDAAYHKEKMLLCKQEEVGIQLSVTPDTAKNSGPIFDIEPLQKVQQDDDNYNVFDNDREHLEQPESVNDTYLEEQGDTNITIDSLDMSTNGELVDQDDDDLARERDLLASLIDKLKRETDDSKNRNKLLESSNKTLVDKLKDLKKFQAELDRYHDVHYASKVEIDCAKAKGDLVSYKMESQKLFNEHTRKINDLNQTISKMKNELFAPQETISIMSQEKEAQNKFYKIHEDKEIEKVIALENKVKVLDDIVYKTGQSVQTMNMLNRNYKTSFVKPKFLKKAQRVNHRLYDIGCYNNNLALMLGPESDKTIRLPQESRSKLNDLNKPLDYKNLNNLYDLFVPQRENSPEQRYFSEWSKISHTPVKNENSKESFNKQTTLLEKRMDESILWDQKCKSGMDIQEKDKKES